MISPHISVFDHAFFFDFDGTLVPIAEKPDAVEVAPQTIDRLKALLSLTYGSVAVVSGRPISVLQRFLSPLDIPLAGSHGLELKLPGHPATASPIDRPALAKAVERLRGVASERGGLLVEEKPASVALHYRQAPDRQPECERLVDDILHAEPGLSLIRGKMVLELKAGSANKAEAISMLMDNAPFRDRIPVYAGDDVTDEDAFRLVNGLMGATIKIGPGDTEALNRLAGVPDFLSWLDDVVANGVRSVAPQSGDVS